MTRRSPSRRPTNPSGPSGARRALSACGRQWWAGLVIALAAGAFACRPADQHQFDSPPPDAPRAALELPRDDLVATISAVGATPAERADLDRLYDPVRRTPVWLDATGRPTGALRDGLRLLRGVAADGLDPGDYPVDDLSREAARLAAATVAPTRREMAQFDVTMSWAVLREFRQVHLGRVPPAQLGFDTGLPPDGDDFPSLLADALVESRLLAAARALAPDLPGYRGLRERLARYRAIAADRALRPISPPAKSVHPGEAYADLPMLRLWLRAFGDLPDTSAATSSADATTYAGDVVEAVRHLQRRYGLVPDGILGRATAAALRVPLAERVTQIVLAMERLRWLPDLGHGRYILVNIPMFRLWAWDAPSATGRPALSMAVIVGRALETRTPVVSGELHYLVFRPDWTVPVSIVRNEIIPAIDKDPAYLATHAMEIVGDPIASPVWPLAPDVRARLRRGTLSVRQRPGPTNALGLVKFAFANDENIYMHDTPSPGLFARSRRDFSHGCVRLEDPVGLASWALQGQGDWSRDRIVAAMHAPISSRVDLDRPAQVLLFYSTAAVMPNDGTLHFADDIYGYDAVLGRALGQ